MCPKIVFKCDFLQFSEESHFLCSFYNISSIEHPCIYSVRFQHCRAAIIFKLFDFRILSILGSAPQDFPFPISVFFTWLIPFPRTDTWNRLLTSAHFFLMWKLHSMIDCLTYTQFSWNLHLILPFLLQLRVGEERVTVLSCLTFWKGYVSWCM